MSSNSINVYSKLNVSTSNPVVDCDKHDSCPLVWSRKTPQNCCECSNIHSGLTSRIQCVREDGKDTMIKIANCYCVYYQHHQTIFASCLHTCYNRNGTFYYYLPRRNGTETNKLICSGTALGLELNRNGRLCGKCKNGYGLPAYSFHFSKCVSCSHQNYLRYIAVAFGPLTIFYFIVIVFRINTTSGRMNGYIFFCQAITNSIQMRFFVSANEVGHYSSYGGIIKGLYALHGIWNLDFFRLFYSFCLCPQASALHIISLDYIVAIYPLFLVICTYIFTLLYNKGNKLIVLLWSPFNKIFSRFRSQWNIKTTLVQAFSTFLLLSYVKMLNVSFNLLLPTRVRNSQSLSSQYYWYYDPSIILFDKSHLPYFLIAVIFTLFCVIFPLFLLCAYPFQCFQRCLNALNFKYPEFHIFMDTFVGCYRFQPCYYRSFAGLYFFLRIALLLMFQLSLSLYLIPLQTILILCVAILFAILHPYTKRSHNVTDVVFFIYLSICLCIHSDIFITEVYPLNYHFFQSALMILLLIPVLYPTYLILELFPVKMMLSKCMFRGSQEPLMESNHIIEVCNYGSTATKN